MATVVDGVLRDKQPGWPEFYAEAAESFVDIQNFSSKWKHWPHVEKLTSAIMKDAPSGAPKSKALLFRGMSLVYLSNIGDRKKQKARASEAKKAFRQISSDPDAAIAQYYLLQLESDPRKAIVQLSKYPERYPSSPLAPNALYQAGVLHLKIARDAEGKSAQTQQLTAADYFGRVTISYPHSYLADDALYQAGKIHYDRKDYKKALETFEGITKEKHSTVPDDMLPKILFWAAKSAENLAVQAEAPVQKTKYQDKAMKYYRNIFQEFPSTYYAARVWILKQKEYKLKPPVSGRYKLYQNWSLKSIPLS